MESVTLPPPDLLMQIANDPSQENFAASFPMLRSVVLDYIQRSGRSFESLGRILDFGCGPGRLLFALQPLLKPHQQLYGCDLNEACSEWAAQNIKFARISRNNVEPPLPYPDKHFDLVYACSVFTHLSLNLQYAWAWELHRVLRPGGIAILTTSAAAFFIRTFAALDYFPKRQIYSINADDFVAVLATEDGPTVEGQREVAVIHSLGAARSVFSAFEMVEQIPISMLAAGQTANLLRRPLEDVIPAADQAVRGFFRAAEGTSDPIHIKVPRGAGRTLRFSLEFDHEMFEGRYLKWVWALGESRLPFNSAFGPNHLIECAVEHYGFDLELRLVATADFASPQDLAFTLRLMRFEP